MGRQERLFRARRDGPSLWLRRSAGAGVEVRSPPTRTPATKRLSPTTSGPSSPGGLPPHRGQRQAGPGGRGNAGPPGRSSGRATNGRLEDLEPRPASSGPPDRRRGEGAHPAGVSGGLPSRPLRGGLARDLLRGRGVIPTRVAGRASARTRACWRRGRRSSARRTGTSGAGWGTAIPAIYLASPTAGPRLGPREGGSRTRGNTHEQGSTVWKYGDNVNTDVIFPGRYTYTPMTPPRWRGTRWRISTRVSPGT